MLLFDIVLNKGKSAVIPPVCNGRRCSLLHPIKQIWLIKTSKNSNLDDWGISLPAFPSRNNLKLHNFSVTPKMVKKVITNLNSSKTLVLIEFQ